MIKNITKAAVIGSGIMGSGIAALLASAGINTYLLRAHRTDSPDTAADDPKLFFAKKKNLFFHMKKDLSRICMGYLDDYRGRLKDCDLIIEAVTEDADIKKHLFTALDSLRGTETVVASNTSGIPLRVLTEDRSQGFKEHFLIMHFFNPVKIMKLLEIVSGPDTKPEITDFIVKWSRTALGKGVVKCKDTPGFAANRIGTFLIATAVHALEEGALSVQDIDFIFGKTAGFPATGLFMLADMLGLDTFARLCENSLPALKNDERKDVYKLPEFFLKMISAGKFGDKTPAEGGFYKKLKSPDGKKSRLVMDIKTQTYSEADSNYVPDEFDSAVKRPSPAGRQQSVFLGDGPLSRAAWKMFSECACYALNRIPEAADSVFELDNAMKWGYGWSFGPFEIIDNLGLYSFIDRLKDEGREIPANLKAMMICGAESFYRTCNGKKQYFDVITKKYADVPLPAGTVLLSSVRSSGGVVRETPSASILDLGDGIFCLEFHSKMNALNREMVDLILETAETVRAQADGLVIGNQGAAFSAGGDLAYMGSLAADKRWNEMDNLIRHVHSAFFGLKYAPFPVVAAPFGKTLGGGAEICLAADRIVSSADLNIGLVEIGSGLIPSGGGIVNMWRRYVEVVPDTFAMADMIKLFSACHSLIGSGQVSASAGEAEANLILRAGDRYVMNRDLLIGEAKKEVLHMISCGYTPPAKTMIPVTGEDGMAAVLVSTFNMNQSGYLTPHMEYVARKSAWVMSGGDARPGSLVSEEYLLTLERETFVELWQTEETCRMADNMLKTGKVLAL